MAVIILGGDQLFAAIQIPPPAIYETIKNNKMVAGMLTYLAGNFLKSAVSNTGAFEIFINGTLVSSAIKNKIIMTPETVAKQVIRFLR